ncbi:MAG TPA: DNA-3-methyladenine glycosylase [Candidatus Saccharimonadales bacterium]|jgi:DNA-3-methyladenine glycosylase
MYKESIDEILAGPTDLAARRLLGCILIRELNGKKVVSRIVETEAYNQTDAASHSYRGVTPRTAIMFGPPGHLYVYFTYGMHYCCNVVTGAVGQGAAVLIRAVEPIEGIDILAQNRRGRTGLDMTNGPAKLCQAMRIDKALNGHDLRTTPLQLEVQDPVSPDRIVQTTRIGIKQAQDVPWRFYIRGNQYVSKP